MSQLLAIYLVIGGMLWLLSEMLMGATRVAYLERLDKGYSVGYVRAVAVVAISLIIVCWPMIYVAAIVGTVRALLRGETT
jgi:hypothetical protein